jgi:hypothetical protein
MQLLVLTPLMHRLALGRNTMSTHACRADDLYRSSECLNRIDPIPEGLYLCAVIKPLYCFILISVTSLLMASLCDIAHIVLASKVRQPFVTLIY